MFQTKNEMKNGMIDRRKDRALEFYLNDDLTNSPLTISTFHVLKYGRQEKAKEMARKKKAELDPSFKEELEKARLAKAN